MARPEPTTAQKAYLRGRRLLPWTGVVAVAVVCGAAASLLPGRTAPLENRVNTVENRVNTVEYRPRGPRSLIVYKIPEKERDTVLRLVNAAKNEIKREHGQYYRELVWQAALIDPNTGKLDPKKFYDGYGWVDRSSFADPYEIARKYTLLMNRHDNK